MTTNYNCNLKKGWNTEYFQTVTDDANKTITGTVTTEKPSGVTFAWKFYSTE